VCAKKRYNKQNHGWNAVAVETKEVGCFVCGYNRCTRALEFHHLHSRVGSPLAMAQRPKKYSLQDILDEIDKCVVLCSNCHREEQDGFIVFSWDSMDEDRKGDSDADETPRDTWDQLTLDLS
jgi:hypothetical protein